MNKAASFGGKMTYRWRMKVIRCGTDTRLQSSKEGMCRLQKYEVIAITAPSSAVVPLSI